MLALAMTFFLIYIPHRIPGSIVFTAIGLTTLLLELDNQVIPLLMITIGLLAIFYNITWAYLNNGTLSEDCLYNRHPRS